MGRKWASIVAKKTAKDANNSRIYVKLGIETCAAAKSGDPDPYMDQKLRFVIDRAKTYNVPKHIIDRVIEKAKGAGDETYSELRYEGLGPSGSMVIVDILANNVNRIATDVRAAFGKNGGNMGVSGVASYMLDNTAIFALTGEDADEILEYLMEKGIDARGVMEEGGQTIIHDEVVDFHSTQGALKERGITDFSIAGIQIIPQTEVTLSSEDQETFEKVIDALEDLEDVQHVLRNVALKN